MTFRKAYPLSIFLLACFLPGAEAALTARHSHTMTLLPDGNILITGGVIANGTTTGEVQMYNMATNSFDTWTAGGGALDTARSSHTATLMSNGTVLIAGGFNAGSPLSSLEICNPATKICGAAGAASLTTAKGGHTAVLLSTGTHAGKVLICGGQSGGSSGGSPITVTETCDLFDPMTGVVSAGGPMVSPRVGHAAALLQGGKVFVTGGVRYQAANKIYEPMNEIYDPNNNSWTPRGGLNQGRVDHTATVLNNGLALIAGGYNAQNIIDNREGGDEDVWTTTDTTYWGYSDNNQNLGTRGYLDGAELFDNNGGPVVIAEAVQGVSPYRTSRHSAALLPDGTWRMYGGYGNIVRTVFSATPALAEDTIFYLTKTGLTTAVINSNSVVRFPLDIDLARPVSGRLVDADAFFSRQLDTTLPSVAVDNATLFLTHSTAALDGLPVGALIPTDPAALPGDFTNTVQLTRPDGTASFEPQSMYSDASLDPTLTVTSSGLTFTAPLYPGDSAKACGGQVTGKVALTLPSIYRGIRGRAIVNSGTILDAAGVYSVTITNGGFADVVIADPTTCDDTACVFVADINLPSIVGTISNLSEGTTIQTSPLNAAGAAFSLTLDLHYTADEIHTGTRLPAFAYGRSDIVIREMIFSSALGFIPKENKWKDLQDTEVSPALGEPVFDHTTLLTPAADTVVLGGRNCETTPTADCLRTAKTFKARSAYAVIVPVHRSEEGDSDWQLSEKLGSKRAYHTSTLLLNGQILTCGGSDGVYPLSTCELMDPVTKQWGPTGAMSITRTKHTATMLPNGTVLAAGGATSPSGVTSSAEIYYPGTGRWTPIAPMLNARQDHTATLLPDGNVLVAGGATLSTYSATSELYITSAAVWIAASGEMTVPRALHTATLLKSGNVLMAGGINGYAAVSEVDLYNFTTRTFSAGPDLNTARYNHTANLLKDGRVIVIGGSNNILSQQTSEIYDGAGPWVYTSTFAFNRANHRSVLLPNGKVMVTGGVISGAVQVRAESYNPDFDGWKDQGEMAARSHHTSVLTRDNYIVNIGGWDGSGYLDTTDIAYFSYSPDMSGFTSATRRQPKISTATAYFNRGERVTLLSGTSNFHGITEASGGGSGPMSSSYSNPRVYMQQADNPSGFMIDLSTRIYSLYGGVNTPATQDWGRTLSSITVISPSASGELPYGYYHMRVAANGQFSEGQVVQVTIPRPTGSSLAPTTSANLIGSTSIQWTWSHTGPAADGFAVFNATDGVFVGFSTFGATGIFTQNGLAPNSEVAIKVADYNTGGYGPHSDASETYYTKAVTPENLTVDYASFDTVALSWDPMGNSAITAYELSTADGDYADSDSRWVVKEVAFSSNHTSTSTVLRGLNPGTTYYFRVQAINGTPSSRAIQDGERTGFSNHASTRTVSNVRNLKGETQYPYSIYWSWSQAEGTPSYRIEDITAGAANSVILSSAIANDLPNYTQAGLNPNTSHTVAVNAYDPVTGSQGPQEFASLYTQAAQPYNAVIANPTPNTLTISWQSENPAGTRYRITGSPNSDLSGGTEFTVLKSSSIPEPSTFTWTGLTPSTRYYASITALNEDDLETVPLSLDSAYTLPDTPTNLRAISVALSGVTMMWDTGNNPDTTIYELRGSTTTNSTGLTGYITTFLPFSSGQNSNVFAVKSLMTSTTYYFDVSARNADGRATGRALSARINTLDGPGGAPAGSIGGSSNPSADVTISGKMPDNRIVSLSVPAGTYHDPTAIAIAPSVTDSCRQNLAETPLVEVSIYTENNAQPQVPVTITISYLPEDAAKITPSISKLVMSRYNPTSGDCLPLETIINPGPRTITAKLNHFSVFQLIHKNPATDLSAVRVYPNPYYTNRGQGFVSIDNMPASTEARIYTLSGDKIWEGTAGPTGLLTWDATNSSGVQVGSGIYLVALDSTGGKKVIKIAVER